MEKNEAPNCTVKRRAKKSDSKTTAPSQVGRLIRFLAIRLRKRLAILRAIDLVKRYRLPCDVRIADIPTTARHGWRKDGTCSILLSYKLIFNGDAKAVHRRVIHEAAHHIAGLEHGHDEHFRRIAHAMYEKEGFPRGKPGDHCGNM